MLKLVGVVVNAKVTWPGRSMSVSGKPKECDFIYQPVSKLLRFFFFL